MDYQSILEKLAEIHNSTPQQIDDEMRKVLHSTGYNIEPVMFIAIAAKTLEDYI